MLSADPLTRLSRDCGIATLCRHGDRRDCQGLRVDRTLAVAERRHRDTAVLVRSHLFYTQEHQPAGYG